MDADRIGPYTGQLGHEGRKELLTWKGLINGSYGSCQGNTIEPPASPWNNVRCRESAT